MHADPDSSVVSFRHTDTNSLLRLYDQASAVPAGRETQGARKAREQTCRRVAAELRRRDVKA